MADDDEFNDGDRTKKFGIGLRKRQKKTYTAKAFSATLLPSDGTLRFFLFPEFCSTSSLAEVASRAKPRQCLSSLVARISPFVTFTSYSYVPHFKRDAYSADNTAFRSCDARCNVGISSD